MPELNSKTFLNVLTKHEQNWIKVCVPKKCSNMRTYNFVMYYCYPVGYRVIKIVGLQSFVCQIYANP